jgi:hypothetical protein
LKKRNAPSSVKQTTQAKHWQVTVFYKDGEKFARVYTDRAKASRFANAEEIACRKTARAQVSQIKRAEFRATHDSAS